MSSSEIEIGILPDPLSSPAWKHIESLLEPAAKLGNLPVIEPGELVWIVWDGMEIIAAATTRVTVDGFAEIILCGGRDAAIWAADLADMICRWAADEGMSRVVIHGRRGWARLIGWKETGRQGALARLEREV